MSNSDPFVASAHDLIGGIPAEMGPWQLELLCKQGLQPHHRLLDLGCGTLRGGLHAIQFLDPGQYCGVDPGPELLVAAKQLLTSAGLNDRKPVLGDLELLNTLEPHGFDYVLTQSVLNHLDARGIEMTVQRAALALHEDGLWVSTGAFSSDGVPDDTAPVDVGEPHGVRPNERLHSVANLGWFMALLLRYGFEMTAVDDHPHPRGLDVFVARKTDGPTRRTVEPLLSEFMAFDTSPTGTGHLDAVQWLEARLRTDGFDVEVVAGEGHPLVVARRGARGGSRGRIAMYGHYDIDDVCDGWVTPPVALTATPDGRWSGLGVADNKAALVARLAAVADMPRSPELLWLIQGEEETGSGMIRRWLGANPLPSADLFLDENGWTAPSGSQRVLAFETDATNGIVPLASDTQDALLAALSVDSRERHVEVRPLNKCFAPGECPFRQALPEGAKYLAIGTNDAGTRIHEPGESVAVERVLAHIRQIRSILTIAEGVQ